MQKDAPKEGLKKSGVVQTQSGESVALAIVPRNAKTSHDPNREIRTPCWVNPAAQSPFTCEADAAPAS